MYITIATGVIANPEDCHPLTKIWLITDCIVFGLSILYLFGQGMKICVKSDQYKNQISKVKSLRASLRLEKGGGQVNNVACSEQELKASQIDEAGENQGETPKEGEEAIAEVKLADDSAAPLEEPPKTGANREGESLSPKVPHANGDQPPKSDASQLIQEGTAEEGTNLDKKEEGQE
jgi:hypothetical protein